MRVAAVVVAAGRGERFGAPKQFAQLDHETLAARGVRTARGVASHVVLVVPADYDGAGEGADVFVTGGATRSDSVRAGLAAVGDAQIVVVHDAARPLASHELFSAVVRAVLDGADGAVPGVALTDTIKRVVRDTEVTTVASTLNRDELVAVQTPQAFRREALERAHANSPQASDDAALVEALGGVVVVVPGEHANLKVTTPEDATRLAALLEEYS